MVVPLFSPRSARLFAAEWSRLAAPRAALHVVAISQAVADGLGLVPIRSLRVAPTPDQRGMLFALGQVQAALEPDQNPR